MQESTKQFKPNTTSPYSDSNVTIEHLTRAARQLENSPELAHDEVVAAQVYVLRAIASLRKVTSSS